MWYAHQPLNQPAAVNAPAIKRALCALLWEEIRPIQSVELTWTAADRSQPSPGSLAITTLDHQGSASSWWNDLAPVLKKVEPIVPRMARPTPTTCQRKPVDWWLASARIEPRQSMPCLLSACGSQRRGSKWISKSNGVMSRALPQRITAAELKSMMAGSADCPDWIETPEC